MTPITDAEALREMVCKMDEAFASVNYQIATVEARIAQRHEQIDAVQIKLFEDAHQVGQLESQMSEVQMQLQQAQATAKFAQDTAVVGAIGAAVQRIGMELASMQQQLEAARKRHTKQEVAASKELAELKDKLVQDEQELTTLLGAKQQLKQQLKHAREETHRALGQAIYRDIEVLMKESRETVETYEKLLGEARLNLKMLQMDLPEKLAEWPNLAKQAQKQWRLQPKLAETETAKAIKALLAYLGALDQGPTIEDANTHGSRAMPLEHPRPRYT